jgi:hypothetical protein
MNSLTILLGGESTDFRVTLLIERSIPWPAPVRLSMPRMPSTVHRLLRITMFGLENGPDPFVFMGQMYCINPAVSLLGDCYGGITRQHPSHLLG